MEINASDSIKGIEKLQQGRCSPFPSCMKGIQIQLYLFAREKKVVGFSTQVSGFFFHAVSTLYLASGWDSTATHDESKIPGGFMSVMWKHSNVHPVLSALPADTKIWSCIPSESGFESEKKTEIKMLIRIYTSWDSETTNMWMTWMNSEPFRTEQQMKIFTFDRLIQLGYFKSAPSRFAHNH